jgi:hypothetical protein
MAVLRSSASKPRRERRRPIYTAGRAALNDDTSAISEPAKRPFARITQRDHSEREPHFSIVYSVWSAAVWN